MIEGMDALLRELNRLENLSLKKPIEEATQLVQGTAKSLCRRNSGELSESIMISTNEVNGCAAGVCYTNKRYATYVELGTGPKGQTNHEGISPDVPVAYTQTPWWIHESMVDKETAEKYHWFKLETNKGVFYQCTGQPARPFLYPALKNNEERIKQIMANGVKEALK